jgi:hypothetical protein
MTARDKKLAVWGVVLILLLFPCVFAFHLLRQANKAADYSAHWAVTAEIEHQLAAVPHGQRYPDSLSQLRLTYPDGGNTSLLSRFTYNSTGTSCVLRTVIQGQEIMRSFP